MEVEDISKKNLNYVLNKYTQIVSELNLRYNLPENVKNSLNWMLEKWETRKKISRASYIIPVGYKIQARYKHPKEKNIQKIENIIISLDTVISALDDTVDILIEDKKEKWEREVTKIINFLYIMSELNRVFPDLRYQKLLIDTILNFIISLTQIPSLEKEYSDKITQASTQEEEEKFAIECLKKRAKDIDIFIELLILYLNIDKEYALTLTKTIKIYRALELFSKDYFDISIDIESKSNTPAVALFKKYQDRKEIFNRTIRNILDELYSEIKNITPKDEVVIFLERLGKEKYDKILQD